MVRCWFFLHQLLTTDFYTRSLLDALPISDALRRHPHLDGPPGQGQEAVHDLPDRQRPPRDRKSTRLNSSHLGISYAVFCLKKKILVLWLKLVKYYLKVR